MKLNRTAQRILIALYFLAIAVIYGVAWRAPSFGLYHDDAVYLVTAKAIVAGHGYTLENLPSAIPQTKYPPLFPLLLALFLRVSANVQWLKLLPLVCAVGWWFVTYRLLRKMGADSHGALFLVGITAASPAVVYFSTNLLSEPLFILLVTAALLFLLEDRIFLAGVATGLAMLTRTAALPLVAACALTLLLRGRFRRAVLFTATAVLLAAPWYAWALVHTPDDPYYGSGSYTALNVLTHFAASEKALIIGTNLMSIFAIPFALLSGITDLYSSVLTFGLLVWCLFKRRQLVPDLFLLFYGVMLLLWPWPSPRFFAPMLPLILWLFWRVARLIPLREALAALVLLAALLPLWNSARRIPAALRTGEFPKSLHEPNDWNQMTRLFTFIRRNTPPDAILAANIDPLFYLETGRKAVRGFVPSGYRIFYQPDGKAVTPVELASTLRRNGVNYVALTPDADFAEAPAFHRSVEALERGGILEPVPVPGLSPEYRLLRAASGYTY